MSRHRRRRTSSQFSPPSSSTSSAAEPPAPPEIIIRYAQSEEDITAIHRFLLVVAQPAMQCEVDVVKSLVEVIRVAQHEVALMAIADGMLIGTMGLIRPTWWYGNGDFLTDRWHFVLPAHQHGEANRMLLAEALKIAETAGLSFFHQGKARKQKNGAWLMMPRVYPVESSNVPMMGSA